MLILAATPIGNLADVSDRLRETLAAADIIACEDTRTTGKLLRLLGVMTSARLLAVHDHNERDAAAEIARLAASHTVVLVSDAGMPAIADPGYRVVRACADAGIEVSAIPGPSAVITALSVSGLASDRFSFEGFVPRKPSERAALIEQLGRVTCTSVLYESPHRLPETLAEFAEAWPQRAVCVCRELTKLHEEVRRGTCAELAAWAAEGVRGEVVIVLAGAAPAQPSLADGIAQVRELMAAGMRTKDAAAFVAGRTGLRKRALYDAVVLEGSEHSVN